MRYDGVKYYKKNDLSLGTSLNKNVPIVSCFKENVPIGDVNTILEFYNICQIHKVGIKHNDWDEEFIEKLNVTVVKLIK